jgi:hypothetical protein
MNTSPDTPAEPCGGTGTHSRPDLRRESEPGEGRSGLANLAREPEAFHPGSLALLSLCTKFRLGSVRTRSMQHCRAGSLSRLGI